MKYKKKMIGLALQSHYGTQERAPLIRALEDIHLHNKPLPISSSIDGTPISTELIGVELDNQAVLLQKALNEMHWTNVVNIMENRMFPEFSLLDKIIEMARSSLSASISLIQENFKYTADAIVKIGQFIMNYISSKFNVLNEIIVYATRVMQYGFTQMLNIAGRLIANAILPIFTAIRDVFIKTLAPSCFNVFSSLGYFAHVQWKGVEQAKVQSKEFLFFTLFFKHDRAIVLNEHGIEKAIVYEKHALQHCSGIIESIGTKVRSSKSKLPFDSKMIDKDTTIEWIFDQCIRFVSFVCSTTTACISVLVDSFVQLLLLGGYTMDPIVKLIQNGLKVDNEMFLELHRGNFILPKVNLQEETKNASTLMQSLKKLSDGIGLPDDVKSISRSGYSLLKNASAIVDLQRTTVPFMDPRRQCQKNIETARLLSDIENSKDAEKLIADVNAYRETFEEENSEYFTELFVAAHEHAKKCFLMAYNRLLAHAIGSSYKYTQYVKGGQDTSTKLTVTEHLDQKTPGEFQKSIVQTKYTMKHLKNYLDHLKVSFALVMQSLRASVSRMRPEDETEFTDMTMEIIARVKREVGSRRKTITAETKALILDNVTINAYGKHSTDVLLGDYNRKLSEAYSIASKYTILQEEISKRSEKGRFIKNIIPKVCITLLAGYAMYSYLIWTDFWSAEAASTMALQVYEDDSFAYGQNYSPVYAGTTRPLEEEVLMDAAELSGGWYPVSDDLKLSKIHHYFLKMTNPITAMAYAGVASSYAAVIAGLSISVLWLGIHIYSLFQVITNSMVDLVARKFPSFDTYERHSSNKTKMWIDVLGKLGMASVSVATAFVGLFLRRAKMIESTLNFVSGTISSVFSLGPIGLLWGATSIYKHFAGGALSKYAQDAINALQSIKIDTDTIAPFFVQIDGLYDPEKDRNFPTSLEMVVTGYNSIILPKVMKVVKHTVREKKRLAAAYNEHKQVRFLLKNE